MRYVATLLRRCKYRAVYLVVAQSNPYPACLPCLPDVMKTAEGDISIPTYLKCYDLDKIVSVVNTILTSSDSCTGNKSATMWSWLNVLLL